MGGDVEHWKRCLVSSIQLFCRNFCQYDSEAKIDGILAITLDKKEVILVTLQETDCSGTPAKVNSSNHPSKEQSEQLESILRYLAPSCRLLKKAPVKATALSPVIQPVWQPVSEGTGSATPDRYTFLRSLGLMPTQLTTTSCPTDGSRITHLQTSSGIKSSMSDISVCSASESFKSQAEFVSRKRTETVNMEIETDGCKKNNSVKASRAKCAKQTSKKQYSVVKTDANGNEKHMRNVTCNRSAGTKFKSPLTSSHALNCNTDVRVCLDLKSVGLMMQEQKQLNQVSRINNSTVLKPVKFARKSCVSNSPSVMVSSVKVPLHTGKQRSKSETLLDECKPEANSSMQIPLKRKYTKRKVAKANALVCQTLCKKPSSSAKEKVNDESKRLDAAYKLVSKRKTSKIVLAVVADDSKNKITGQKLLNKTKATRLKVLYRKKKGQRSIESVFEKRTKNCGKCSGCRTKENCMICPYCKDMKQNGGPNRLRKKCRLRQCRALLKKTKTKKYGSKSDSLQDTKKELKSSSSN